MQSIFANLIHNPLQWAIRRPRFAFVDVVDLIFSWIETAGQRRRLASLDDRMLSDIGIGRADVEGETSRPFWDVA